jgi:hypothetical protein
VDPCAPSRSSLRLVRGQFPRLTARSLPGATAGAGSCHSGRSAWRWRDERISLLATVRSRGAQAPSREGVDSRCRRAKSGPSGGRRGHRGVLRGGDAQSSFKRAGNLIQTIVAGTARGGMSSSWATLHRRGGMGFRRTAKKAPRTPIHLRRHPMRLLRRGYDQGFQPAPRSCSTASAHPNTSPGITEPFFSAVRLGSGPPTGKIRTKQNCFFARLIAATPETVYVSGAEHIQSARRARGRSQAGRACTYATRRTRPSSSGVRGVVDKKKKTLDRRSHLPASATRIAGWDPHRLRASPSRRWCALSGRGLHPSEGSVRRTRPHDEAAPREVSTKARVHGLSGPVTARCWCVGGERALLRC